MNYFLETSALVKRYVSEVGSSWVTSLIVPPALHTIHLAALTSVEVVSAISRRQRGGSISATNAARLIAQFQLELAAGYYVVDLTPALIAEATRLAATHALRGSDAIQLAAAVEVSRACLAAGAVMTLISADVELNAAALAEGLAVNDPNSHP